MKHRSSVGDWIFDFFNYVLLAFLAVAAVYPFLYVFFASFSDPLRLMSHQGILVSPLGFTLRGYELVIRNPNIRIGYSNTIFYVSVGTFVNILMTAIGAYAVSRKRSVWARPLMFVIVFTMFFHGGLIPLYVLVRGIGLYDTRAALIVPTAVGTWNLIIMRTSLMQVPDSLEESARMDGANDLHILFRILLPITRATVAVLVLFYAVYRWNEWFMAMVFLRSRSKYPLQLILREILVLNDTGRMTSGMFNPQEEDLYGNLVKYTTVIVAVVPILLLYPFLQKHFVKGVMIGSLKA